MKYTRLPSPSTPWTCLVSISLWCLSLSVFTVLASFYILGTLVVTPKQLQPVTKKLCRLLLVCAGQRLIVEGSFPPLSHGPYLYLFNHSSLLDSFVVLGVLPEHASAVGKKAQFSMPIWGWVLKRWGAVPIHRSDRAEAIESLNTVQAHLANGLSLLIAPEGTRSRDGGLGRFKQGPFHVASNTQAPIVPMAIDGAYAAKHKGSWLLRPGTIIIRIGETIYPGDFGPDAVNALRSATREHIAEMLLGTQQK